MIFTKVTHVGAQFQIFDWSGQISPNLYFDRLLLLKVYKISAKKVQRSYASWYWRVMQNLKKNLFLVSKMIRIWWIFIRALKSLKFAFSLAPFVQSYNVWPEKVQSSYLSWCWKSTQNLKKNWLWFGKWPEEFGKFSSEHLKSVKIGTLMEFFCPK